MPDDDNDDPGRTHYYGDGCDHDHGRADHPAAHDFDIPARPINDDDFNDLPILDLDKFDQHLHDKLDKLIDHGPGEHDYGPQFDQYDYEHNPWPDDDDYDAARNVPVRGGTDGVHPGGAVHPD